MKRYAPSFLGFLLVHAAACTSSTGMISDASSEASSEASFDASSDAECDGGQCEEAPVCFELESCTLTSPMEAVSDPVASGGEYITCTSGDGHCPSTATAECGFALEETGTYLIVARVFAENGSSDSFLVQVDDGPPDVWHLNPLDAQEEFGVWRDDEVNHEGEGSFNDPEFDPYEILLAAGDHSIVLTAREPGARIDSLCLQQIECSPPTTCAAEGVDCGTIPDGCGETLVCGDECNSDCTHYVSTSGVDSPGGGGESNPWRTINFGTRQLFAGDTLCVMSGIYYESNIGFVNSGTPNNWISLQNYNGELVYVESSGNAFSLSDVSHVRIDGMNTRYGNCAYYIVGAFKGLTHDIKITNSSILEPDCGFYFESGAYNITVENCTIEDIQSTSNAIKLMTSHLCYNGYTGDCGSDYVMDNYVFDNVNIDGVPHHNGYSFAALDNDIVGRKHLYHEEYLYNNITIQNSLFTNISHAAIYAEHVRIDNMAILNNDIDGCSRGIYINLKDSLVAGNEVHNIPNVGTGQVIELTWEGGNSDNNIFENNWGHDNHRSDRPTVSIYDATNTTIVNTRTSGPNRYLGFHGGNHDGNFVINHEDGATVGFSGSGGVTFQFTDDRDFSVTGEGTIGAVTHSGGVSQIIATTNSDTVWMIQTTSPPPLPTPFCCDSIHSSDKADIIE